MIAYLLHPDSWGKGIAKQAVSQMMEILRRDHGISTYWASIDPRNKKSIALIERLKFQATISREPLVEGDLVFELFL